jgi:hypothetical protein
LDNRSALRTSSRPDLFFTRYPKGEQPKDRYWLHALLFLLTLASTVYAGGLLAGRFYLYEQAPVWFYLGALPVTPVYLYDGFLYGMSLLLFLTVHEFGHYFAARFHRISVTLPYYIPFPFNGIGTFGAVIRIREPLPSTRKLFDVGAAGPLAGFVAALAVLLYALATLPPPTYMLDIPGHEALHDYIRQFGSFPSEMPAPPPEAAGMTLVVGQTPLFWLLSQFFDHVPPMYEIYHYPALFAGWLALFFTALNLLPVGQLDGGHVMYSLVGPRRHRLVARFFVLVIMTSFAIGFMGDAAPAIGALHPLLANAGWFILSGLLYVFLTRIFGGDLRFVVPALLGVVTLTAVAHLIEGVPEAVGWSGWLLFLVMIVYLIRVEHPPVITPEPLTRGRKIAGIACLVIFVLCFSIKPLYFV